MKEKKILKNLKNNLQSVPVVIDVNQAFYPINININSWFFIGRCQSEGHDLAFLLHFMTARSPDGNELINGVFSVTDKTTGWYDSTDSIVPLGNSISVEDDVLHIIVSNGELHGNLDEIHLKAQMPGCSVDVSVDPLGDVIYNGGNGLFPLLGAKDNYQYSCPDMIMNGKITIEDKNYLITNGSCWFDRQYNTLGSDIDEEAAAAKDGGFSINPKWGWMGIKLDNGESISLWDIPNLNGISNCFATILHQDGTQTVSPMKSMIDGSEEIWISDKTNQHYPTKWYVEIPDFDIKLTVRCVPKEQEIISKIASLNKYEAESTVEGTYAGKKVSGECCVELLGLWR